MKDLGGRVAVVTGAASGIGRGMAEAFAGAGMRVVLSDLRADALETTTESLRETDARVEAVVADVADAQQVEALARRTLEAFGAVHVVCNNAGVASKQLSPLGGSPRGVEMAPRRHDHGRRARYPELRADPAGAGRRGSHREYLLDGRADQR